MSVVRRDILNILLVEPSPLEAQSINDIVEAAGWSRIAVAREIDRMVDEGLVVRTHGEDPAGGAGRRNRKFWLPFSRGVIGFDG